MACEFRVMAVHVHGHEADIEAFFEAVDEALDGVVASAPALFPSIEIIDPGEDDPE